MAAKPPPESMTGDTRQQTAQPSAPDPEVKSSGGGMGPPDGPGGGKPGTGDGRGPAAAIDVRAAKRRYRLSAGALLAAIAACIYGFFIDTSERPDPFDPQPGLWTRLANGQPHPALAVIPVVPVGFRGIFTNRPKDTSWINSPNLPGGPASPPLASAAGIVNLIPSAQAQEQPEDPKGEKFDAGAVDTGADFIDPDGEAPKGATPSPSAAEISTEQDRLNIDNRGARRSESDQEAPKDAPPDGPPPQSPLTSRKIAFNPINEAHCLPAEKTCWAVGDRGIIMATTDGGVTWTRQQSGTDNTLYSVIFVSPGRGWIVGHGGTILSTEDGGATWTQQQSGTGDDLSSVTFVSSEGGWAVGDFGTILSTKNSGATWTQQMGGMNVELISVFFYSLEHGWAVEIGRTIHSTVNSGATWTQQNGTGVLWSVTFSSPQRGWAVGDSGTILSTEDGGANWIPQRRRTNRDLRSVHFQPDGQIGWVSSGWGPLDKKDRRPTILQTLDGGANWETLSYRHLPAPWVLYLALPGLIFAFYGVAVTYRPAHAAPPEHGIASTGRTDRPIGWNDPDVLGLKDVALGVSRFLRNTRTEPPLSIAVTGRWGTGKSSLMNLITEDLKRYGTRAVWFNAWHHQKEEHLLAALLENIRAQAVPPLWRMSGIIFRTRLVFSRIRHSLGSLIVLVIAVIAVWLVMRAQFAGYSFEDTLDSILGWFDGETSSKPESEADPAAAAIVNWIRANIGVGAFGSILAGLFTQMARLRLSPARLMATLSDKARIGQFANQLSFRYRFACEFDDLCGALRYGSNPGLVIMIDDLDRCRSESVLEVLEAVNFLVTAGRCFIFLGIDEEKVVSSVAQGFKDSILDLPDIVSKDENAGGKGNAGKELKPDAHKLAEFANHYLEKLINMSVPVPQATMAASATLSGARKQDAGAANPWPERIRRVIRNAPDVCGPALMIAALSLMIFLGTPASAPKIETGPDAPRTTQSQPTRGTSGTQTGAPAAGSNASEPDGGKPREVSVGDLQSNALVRLSVFFATLALLAGLFLLRRSSTKASGQVVDSAHFASALSIWHPVIFATNPTPRGVKRHHNRLRFHAMRVRPREDKDDWIDHMFKAKTEAPAGGVSTDGIGGQMSEEKIVALVALEALDPGLLDLPGDEIRKAFVTKARAVWDSGDDLFEVPDALAASSGNGRDEEFPLPWEAIDRFAEAFVNEWPPTQDELERFRTLTRSVRA